MVNLALQDTWIWILLGAAVAIVGWWFTLRQPNAGTGKLFAPAVGFVLILLTAAFINGSTTGQFPLRF